MRGQIVSLVILDKWIRTGCRGINSPDRKKESCRTRAPRLREIGRAINLAPSRNDIQHISIGHDSGAGLTILLPKAARREAGYAVSGWKLCLLHHIWCSFSRGESGREKYAARYSTSLNPKLKWIYTVWAMELLCRSSNVPAYHSVAQTNPLFTKARR